MILYILIQFATLLEEFRFMLERTISADKALRDGIIALYPNDSHLPGLEDSRLASLHIL